MLKDNTKEAVSVLSQSVSLSLSILIWSLCILLSGIVMTVGLSVVPTIIAIAFGGIAFLLNGTVVTIKAVSTLAWFLTLAIQLVTLLGMKDSKGRGRRR